MDLEENASSDFTGNTIVKIEKGLVGTWREGVLYGRDVWFVTEVIY